MLIRLAGDWELAEECAQDAFAAALTRWPTEGIPARPGGWLATTARNRAVDRLRRSAVEAGKLRDVSRLGEPAPVGYFPDERLELMFTCDRRHEPADRCALRRGDPAGPPRDHPDAG